jgi:hypothetical protein
MASVFPFVTSSQKSWFCIGRSVMQDNILWVMCRHKLWCMMSVALKFWTVIVTTTELLHINNCYLSLSFYYWDWNKYSKRKKVVYRTALMKKKKKKPGEAIQNTVWVWKFSTEIQVYLQPKGMSLDEATIPWQGGLKFGTCNPQKIKYGMMVWMVCEAVSGYICKMKKYRQGAEIGGHSFISFRQKLRPESSYFCNSDNSGNTARQKGKSLWHWED